MSKIFVFFLSLHIFFFLSEACSAKSVKQETKGDQSPTVYNSPGATSIINYHSDAKVQIDQAMSSIKEESEKCIKLTMALQTQKLKELNETLAGIFAKNERGTEEDAQKWAKDIIEKTPEFKKEIESNNNVLKKINEELSKNLMGKVYQAIAYVLETVDSKFMALKELNSGATYMHENKFILFSEDGPEGGPYLARSFIFPNGNRIKLIITPGRINQSLIQTCPSLNFQEYIDQKLANSFQVEPNIGAITILSGNVRLAQKRQLKNIKYQQTGEDILTEKFREEFNITFSEFIQIAFSR